MFGKWPWEGLDVEEEGDDVAVLHPIAAALGAETPRRRASTMAPQAIMSSKGTTSARMNPRSMSEWMLPRRRRRRAFGHGPRPNFLGNVGEEGDPLQ